MNRTQGLALCVRTSGDVEVSRPRADVRTIGAELPLRTVAAVVSIAAPRPADALAGEATTSCIDATTPTLRSTPPPTRQRRESRISFPRSLARTVSGESAEPTDRTFCCANADHRHPPDARRMAHPS